jgi:hypothetical protein
VTHRAEIGVEEVTVRIHPDPTINVSSNLAGGGLVVDVGDLNVESHCALVL